MTNLFSFSTKVSTKTRFLLFFFSVLSLDLDGGWVCGGEDGVNSSKFQVSKFITPSSCASRKGRREEGLGPVANALEKVIWVNILGNLSKD